MDLIWFLSIIVAYEIILYLLSLLLKRLDIADIGWGPTFILIYGLLFYSFGQDGLWGAVQYTVGVLVMVWALRLAFHIWNQHRGRKEDRRYQSFRDHWEADWWWRSFFQVFLLQGFMAVLISLPLLHLSVQTKGFGILSIIGVALWLHGFYFEVLGDLQMSYFRKHRPEGKKFIDYGLWAKTRHPNYYGEIVMWWSLWLISIDQVWAWWPAIGPLVITYLLAKVSGVPKAEERFKGDKDFEEYKKRVRPLLPIPKKIYPVSSQTESSEDPGPPSTREN